MLQKNVNIQYRSLACFQFNIQGFTNSKRNLKFSPYKCTIQHLFNKDNSMYIRHQHISDIRNENV